jgi:ABC-type spermidine/putrescine transport system permease subunit II
MNWPLFQNSLLVALGATALSLLLGTAVALWLLTL